MRKTIQSAVTRAIQQGLKEYLLIILRYCAFFILFVYLTLNIFFSQNISQLYVGVANDDVFAVTEFLQKIKPLPEFRSFFDIQKRIYGDSIESEVYKDEFQIRQKIQKFESALQKNQKSRDLLYGLSKLYNKLGETDKAKEYLEKAREIDPTIK
ncbi:tetratricopeptide repeat protein [Candidatus Roizmanbacteria bacterium]|nr:tetratricopeptide repeat protein [Candidatus Roizmanbacteria bacterium]